MIKVYFLPVQTINGAEQVAGVEVIHDALLHTTEDPGVRKLIMNTTPDEHDALKTVATSSRDPDQEEIDLYNAQVIITPPDPDIARAEELLSTSPTAITQPEMWELMRIFGRFHGIST